jgi:SpoU rRNA methylase family enzyme
MQSTVAIHNLRTALRVRELGRIVRSVVVLSLLGMRAAAAARRAMNQKMSNAANAR